MSLPDPPFSRIETPSGRSTTSPLITAPPSGCALSVIWVMSSSSQRTMPLPLASHPVPGAAPPPSEIT
jgi:hypothetical protein